LFDILLIGAILYGIYWFVMKRRRSSAAAGTSYYQGTSQQTVEPPYPPTYGSTQTTAYEEVDEVSRGLEHVQQMDSSFEETRFRDQAMDIFFDIQGAWAQRDMKTARSSLTDEMYRVLQGDADKLRAEGRINRLENIAVRSVDLVEVWQESGQDFITVKLYANLLDYTVDEGSGHVVSGSKDDPVKFEEHWTFCRPVGNNPWRLSAISQAKS
jgi:predicted lipid-binding transport protein (Tim44 family)